MIDFLIFHLFYLLILFFQWAVVPMFSIGDVQPNIALVYLIFWSWRHSRCQGTLAGFTSGLLADMLSGGLWGQQALSKTLSGYFAGSFSINRYGIRLMVVFALVFGLSIIHEIMMLIISCWQDLSIFPRLVLRYAIPSSFYTALAGSVIQFILGLIKRYRGVS